MRQFKDFGFLTVAQNTNVDYLNLAYLQAKNIRKTQKIHNYSIIVDEITAEKITNEHRLIFDQIIVMNRDFAKHESWKQSNEWQVFNLTPYKETIKLESDLLFTRDISHWLPALRHRDVCFSYHCRNYQGKIINQSPYRNFFRKNELPDIYTGMYYFRYSKTASELFSLAKDIYLNWDTVKNNLVQCDSLPSTDVVFALASKILGQELCTIPSLDFFNFTHMKSGIQGWSDLQPWTDYVNVEHNEILRINNINQYQPVHYHEKSFIS